MWMRVRQTLTVLCLLGLAGAVSADPQPLTSQTFTSTVGQQIPDGPPGGGAGTPLLDTITVPFGAPISSVEVYIDISIVDWSSDLIIRLTSPEGTELRLFFIGEGGEPATNPAGWYPTDFMPKDDLSAWVGETTQGDWVLDARDYSNEAVGTLNEWRLKVNYDSALPQSDESWSGVKTLYR